MRSGDGEAGVTDRSTGGGRRQSKGDESWDDYDAGDEDEDTWDDRPPEELDDERDRQELRRRYYGLLQELRVLLPGVQVLVAFLLTAPFADRFSDLDDLETDVYAVALISGVLAIIAFVAPTAFHRIGWRRSRSMRLRWSIRMLRVGLFFMALAFDAALFVVLGLLFERTTAIVGAAAIGIIGVVAWVVLPLVGQQRNGDHD
jgi:hypothetical protein